VCISSFPVPIITAYALRGSRSFNVSSGEVNCFCFGGAAKRIETNKKRERIVFIPEV
jgi:hypothetical protein